MPHIGQRLAPRLFAIEMDIARRDLSDSRAVLIGPADWSDRDAFLYVCGVVLPKFLRIEESIEDASAPEKLMAIFRRPPSVVGFRLKSDTACGLPANPFG